MFTCQITPCGDTATHRLGASEGRLVAVFVPPERLDDVPYWCESHCQALIDAADRADRGGTRFIKAIEDLGGVDLR